MIAEVDLASIRNIGTLATGIEHYQFNEADLSHPLMSIFPGAALPKQFALSNRRAANISTVRNLAAIDVVSHLQDLVAHGVPIPPIVIANAKRDEEILILPLDPLMGGGVGRTALLDMGCISGVEFFELV